MNVNRLPDYLDRLAAYRRGEIKTVTLSDVIAKYQGTHGLEGRVRDDIGVGMQAAWHQKRF